MTRRQKNTWLFVSAIVSRTLLFLAYTHWLTVGGMVLIGMSMDMAADYTSVTTPLFVIVIVIMIRVLNRDGLVSQRIRRGIDDLRRHSIPIILAGLGSNIGGLIIWGYGAESAGWWAIVLGGAAALCESWVLTGPMFLGVDDSSTTNDES